MESKKIWINYQMGFDFKPYASTTVGILMSVALIAAFLGIFFFTYAKTVERKIVVDNVKYTVRDLTENLNIFIPDETSKNIEKQLSEIKLGDMSAIDKEVDDANKELLKKAFKFLGIVLVVGLGLAGIIAYVYNVDFLTLFVRNLILLAGVALTEFVFLRYVATDFISANPNVIKKTVVEVIMDKQAPLDINQIQTQIKPLIQSINL